MLIGSNGYEYAGVTYERTSHRSATEDGCLDCHMKTTSQNVVGGHSFNMAWGEEGGEILNTAACARCHGEITDFNQPGIAEENFSVQDSVDVLIGELRTKLEAAGLWEGGVDGDVKVGATTSADSAGALWNLLMAKEDRSHGIHNPKYIMGLLQSSIEFMQGTLPHRSFAARK
jgi:formate-dependent nitrite reductase cytochrome c552 subunit